MIQVDWQEMGAEAVHRLQEMLRFDTTNPPGGELELVRHLAAEAEREGLAIQVFEPTEARGNLVVRLKGDGSERPILFLSHLDVVPAEPDKWTHPPFGGTVADGFVWGRGAIDSKLTGAVQMQVILMCKRLGLPLKRDLVLVAAADEERGGTWGVQWLVEQQGEIFDAEYGINEAGGFALMVDGKPLYTCQVAEKGSAPVDLVGKGRPGHSSVPHGDNAIFALAEALQALGKGQMAHRVVPSVRAFFEGAAEAMDRPEVADLLREVLNPQRCEAALEALPVGEATRLMFAAMVRNTCAPTVLDGGLKRNVIPSEVRAQLSGRPLPGVEEAAFLEEVRNLAGETARPELVEPFRSGVAFAHKTPLFEAIRDSMARFDSDGVVVPYMQTGGTDGRFLKDLDMQIYGFIPMRYESGMDFFDLCHGHDERVSVDNVQFAVQVLFDVICRLNRIPYSEACAC